MRRGWERWRERWDERKRLERMEIERGWKGEFARDVGKGGARKGR